MPKILPYNPALKPLAAKLRKNMTFGEILLWNELKGSKLFGLDFDRQRCVDNYIVDFYCKLLMLAIEVDGHSHNNEDSFRGDESRQERLESFGVTVLRFSEREVKYDMPNVLRTIEICIVNIFKTQPDVHLPAGIDRSFLEE